MRETQAGNKIQSEYNKSRESGILRGRIHDVGAVKWLDQIEQFRKENSEWVTTWCAVYKQ